MGLMSLALLLIPSFSVAFAAEVINIRTDKSYEPGENVKVEGSTNITGAVTVIVTNSSGHEIESLEAHPEEDGEFSVSFTLDEDASVGIYLVNATVGSIYNTTSFEVVVESEDGEEGEGVEVQSEEEDPDDETMSLEDLLSAIERAFRFIEKANETATTLEEEGYDMTLFWKKLNGLNESLTELNDDINSDDLAASVETFRELKKEISQLNGLLSSITKNVKEMKALQFTEHMMRRIGDLESRIDGLETTAETEEFRSNIKAHERKLARLRLTLNSTIPPDDIEVILDELEGVTQDVDSELDGQGDWGYSLKEMYKLQARIEVFNTTVERMKERGKTMNRLQEKLENAAQMLNDAELLMEQWEEAHNAKNWGKMKNTISDTDENLRGVGKTIREMNKSNKGGNGKSNGNG